MASCVPVGQTRPGRLGDAPPAGASPAPASPSPAADPRAFIQQTVSGSPAAVFSKLVCPSSRKAKEILGGQLPQGRFTVVELDQRPNGAQVQDELERMTGKHTVPSVWIGGQFVGGADELAELQRSGQLQQRLGAAA